MYRQRRVAAVIVAAGTSSRMGFDKMFHRVNGEEVLRLSIARMDEHPYVDELVVVGGANLAAIQTLLAQKPPQKPVQTVLGGETRADSVAAGVAACGNASLVAVHDGARPFVSASVITNAIEAAADSGAAAPAIPVKDTIKTVLQTPNGTIVDETLNRSDLRAIQTPQVFDRASFARAISALPAAQRGAFTDDCMVMERAGVPVRLVEGEETNLKITTPADLGVALAKGGASETGARQAWGGASQATAYDMVAEAPGPARTAGVAYKQSTAAPLPRIGHGYDVHKLVPGRPLILGGVHIPHTFGLLGHSDADVLAHAVSDALLGAVALGDIGKHFPDTDPNYAGADSLLLLKKVGELVYRTGYAVGNIDATLLCQAPKLAPHIPAMRQKLSTVLCIDVEAVSVKATTEEGLGFTGSGQGISAHCVAMLAPL